MAIKTDSQNRVNIVALMVEWTVFIFEVTILGIDFRPGRVLYFGSVFVMVEWTVLIFEVTLLGIDFRPGRVLY